MEIEKIRLERGSLLALLDEAVTLARAFVGRLFLGVALPPALAAGLMAVLPVFMMRDFMGGVPQSDGDFLNFFGGFFLTFLLFLVYMTLMGMASSAVFAGAASELHGEKIGPLSAWRWVLKPRILGTLALMGILVSIGSVFCLLPGIYLMVIWAVTVPIMLWEDRRGLDALSRSRQLVVYGPDNPLFSPGMGWVLLVGITVAVLHYGVSMAVQLPLSLIQQVFVVRHIMGQAQTQMPANPMALFPAWFFVVQAISAVLSSLAQILVMFFSASAFNLLYLRLKGRCEGHDLISALDRLGVPE